MFTSGSSQNPFTYATETLFEQLYTYDQNPNSTQEEPTFMLNFPSPFLDQHDLPLSHILPQQQPTTIHGDVVVDQNEKSKNKTIYYKGKNSSMEIANKALMEPKPCEVKPARRRNFDATPQKRTRKKDRHSKICTAQGVRDRRMRLSLQIARKFFDLQDMLGFDKASKTIEWLFSKSKKAIEELSTDLPQIMDNSSSEEKSESLMFECEVVASGMEEYFNNEAKNGMAAKDVTLQEIPNVKINKNLRNSTYNHHHARESREKARARARERSREKMIIKHLENTKQWYEPNSNNLDQLGSFSPFETLEESTYYTQKSSPHEADSHSIDHEFANVGIIEKYLGTENLTQIAGPMFSYQNDAELSYGIDSSTSFLGILGNWDTNNARINSSNGAVMNTVSLAGNPTSTCLATSNFPFLLP